MSEYICNLVIPGAAKSGTTTLHALLDLHPDVCMSRFKEPQHFSFDELYSNGAKAHNTLFDHCRDACYYGESSQCYFFHEHAIERIHEDLDAPRIILILRDPIERLLSHYAWRFKLGVERSGLMEAVRERGWVTEYERRPEDGIYQEHGGYLACSHYSKYVPLWVDAFGTVNVLILTTDEMKASQSRVAARCFDFLGLSATNDSDITPRGTTAATIRRGWPIPVSTIIDALPLSLMSWMRTKKQYWRLRWAFARWITPKPDMRLSSDDLRFLRETLADDIAFYEKLTIKEP